MLFFNKHNLSATLGNVIEWYDFCLFGYFAPQLARVFFPDTMGISALVYVFITFASGYIMRPLGGIIFGYLGDSVGHGYALYCSICLIIIPTALIGFLPDYHQIGFLAPVLLLVARMLQGLSAGGQYIGAIIFLHAQRPHQGAEDASMAYMGSLFGYLLASTVGFVTIHLFPDEWSWRVPFLLSILFVPFIHYCRQNLLKSVIRPSQSNKIKPIYSLLLKHKLVLLKMVLLASVGGIYYSSFFVFLVSYMTLIAKIDMGNTLLINILCLISSGFSIVFFAKLADRFGRKPVVLFSSFALVFLLYPAFQLIDTGEFYAGLLAVWLLTTCNTAFMAACAVIYVEIFPKEVQFTGCAIAYNIGAGVVGGLTPVVLTLLLQHFNTAVMCGFLVLCAVFAVLFILFSIPETKGHLPAPLAG